ncbi:MAG: hypothetical protein MJK15_18570 [Colwellia sp.]|nr:hypothetical protein [Colwellia sp.]
MIQSIYDGMWDRFVVASKSNEYDLDANLLDLEKDTRRGITALAYLNQGNSSVVDKINSFQRAVQYIEPDQYYQPREDLHLTLLSVITCVPEFKLSDIDAEAYIQVFKSVLRRAEPIEVKYQGVSASTNCIIIQGYPVDGALEQLRSTLKSELRSVGLRSSFDSRYNLVGAHSSVVRFRVPISMSESLLALCQKYRNHDFGSIVFSELELVFNNWYQTSSVTKCLSKGTLVSEIRV